MNKEYAGVLVIARREGRTAESVHGDRIKVEARKVYLADPHAVLALERQLEASVLEWGEHLARGGH